MMCKHINFIYQTNDESRLPFLLQGNEQAGAAYPGVQLIADDFYSGLPMSIGFRKLASTLPGEKMLFQMVRLQMAVSLS